MRPKLSDSQPSSSGSTIITTPDIAIVLVIAAEENPKESIDKDLPILKKALVRTANKCAPRSSQNVGKKAFLTLFRNTFFVGPIFLSVRKGTVIGAAIAITARTKNINP
jgi:hypothetical protein